MKDDSIKEIYEKYAKSVKLYVMSLCQNPDLADDVTADTFVKAIKNIEKFHGDNIMSWLCSIAKNTYIDLLRKKETQNVEFDDDILNNTKDQNLSPFEEVLRSDNNILLYTAMQKLDSLSREVLYLKIFANLSYKQIGEILGKSESWARVVFYRSKIKMKGYIEYER